MQIRFLRTTSSSSEASDVYFWPTANKSKNTLSCLQHSRRLVTGRQIRSNLFRNSMGDLQSDKDRVTSAILASGLTFEEIVSGMAISARRRAIEVCLPRNRDNR